MDVFIKNLGLKIKNLRKDKGLTQDGLATEANISGKYLGMIERGEVNTSVKVLKNLSLALNVNIAELFAFEDRTT